MAGVTSCLPAGSQVTDLGDEANVLPGDCLWSLLHLSPSLAPSFQATIIFFPEDLRVHRGWRRVSVGGRAGPA